MPRSRRLALVSAVLLLGLAACGSDDEDSSDSTPTSTDAPSATDGPVATTPTTDGEADGPKVIEVGDQSAQSPTGAPAADAPMAEADSRMIAYIEFEYAGELVDLTSPAPSWFFAPSTEASLEDIGRLADALGIAGEVRELPAEFGGGYTIGPDDGSAPSLTLAPDGMKNWWYSGGVATSGPMCEIAEPLPAEDPSGSTPSSDAPDQATEPICEPIEPPADVPSAADAEARTTELLQALGFDPAEFVFDTFSDDWSSSVNAYLVLDGIRSNLSMYFSFGGEGVLSWAGGFLGTPQPGDEYPRIGIEAAVERLNAPIDVLRDMPAIDVPVGETGAETDAGAAETDAAEPPASDTAESEEPRPDPTMVADAPIPVDCDDITVSCVPPSMEPEVITLTGVEPSLEQLWAVDGTVWLLPAYSFTSDDELMGGPYSVLAVPDEFLDRPDDGEPAPEPVPFDTGAPADTSGGGVQPGAPGLTFAELVDVTVEEAAKIAEMLGYEMRVVREDGVDLAVTEDYNPQRINVAVENGVVTEALSVG